MHWEVIFRYASVIMQSMLSKRPEAFNPFDIVLGPFPPSYDFLGCTIRAYHSINDGGSPRGSTWKWCLARCGAMVAHLRSRHATQGEVFLYAYAQMHAPGHSRRNYRKKSLRGVSAALLGYCNRVLRGVRRIRLVCFTKLVELIAIKFTPFAVLLDMIH